MATRMQITMSTELLSRARSRAAQQGISLAEYIRRLVGADTTSSTAPANVHDLFDLGSSGGSDIANHKDHYLAAALEAT